MVNVLGRHKAKLLLFITFFFFFKSCADDKQDQSDFGEFAQQFAQMLQDPEFTAQMEHAFHEDFMPDKVGKTKKGGKHAQWDKLNFYQDYLQKYYPKVFVIRELFFEKMTPKQIAKALRDIVEIFTEQPWFYFVDDTKQCNLAFYWEYILDQLSFISEFLKLARVDVLTHEVFLPEEEEAGLSFGFLFETHGFGGHENRNTKNLFTHLKEQGEEVLFDLYALSFDYVIKLFNEGILLKNVEGVQRCFSDLKFILKKLEDSVYEQDYQSVLKTCKELMEKLKAKLGVDDMAMLEDFFEDDEHAKQMARESIELGYM